MSLSTRSLYALAFVSVLLATLFIYWPGLNGIFLVDDVYNLNTLNAYGGVTDWKSLLAFVFDNNSGMLGRPVSMLSFLINDQYYPGSVESYRYTNLMIHCLCGVFVFVLARQLVLSATSRGERFVTEVALIAMAWWLLAPLNVSTTLYIIQRMTQLAALFGLVGLWLFVYGRQQIASGNLWGRVWIVIGLFGFGGLSVLSKENGALIFLFAGVIELTIANSRKEKSDPFVLLVICFPLLMGAAYFVARWSSLTGSSVRDFTVLERLLTEARILWDYLAKIIFPLSGKMGLVHDDIVISRSLLSPISTLLAVLAHVALLVATWLLRKRFVWLFLAVSGFYAGHLLESTVIPLELYFEHRNYFPAIFVCIGLSVFLWSNLSVTVFARSGLCLLIFLSAFVCMQRADIWGNPKTQIYIWAQEHPDSLRAQTMYARSLIAEKRYEEAETELYRLQKKWPEAIHNDLVILNHVCVGKMKINFSLDELYNKMKTGRYDGSLPSIFEETFRLYREGACEIINAGVMENLFFHAYSMDNAAHTFKAKLAFWEAEFHTMNGNLEGAIKALDKTYKYQKDNFLIYMKSSLLYSAGLYDLAQSEIERAILLEENKMPFKQFHLQGYRSFSEKIRSKMQ